MTTRAQQLADRVAKGAFVLGSYAQGLSDAQWRTIVPPDGRSVGVLVHHVATMYPIEMAVIQRAVQGQAITDVTWDVVAQINGDHAREHATASKQETLDLLARNSRDASDEIRRLSDADLDRAVPFSLSFGAPMTVQFIIEDHPLRHPWHHLARVRAALSIPGDGVTAARGS